MAQMSDDPLRLGLVAHAAGLIDASQLARIAYAAGEGQAVAQMLRAMLGASTVEALNTGATLDVGARLAPGSLPTLADPVAATPEVVGSPELARMLALGLKPGVFSRRYAAGPELGRGGVGVVAVAHDALMGRSVAVKTLLQAGSQVSTQQLARFVAEARTTAQLDHPNIVPVHDFGQQVDGSPCFTMRWVRGRSLEEVLAARAQGEGSAGAESLSEYRLIQILAQVCMAVDYAHSKGVIHRDLKPANIMVGDFGEVLLMDWGVAKVAGASLVERDASEPVVSLGDSAAQTLFGGIVGTPGYMPPEQARGDGSVDARSDVWSLGAVLYEVLTGQRPYVGRSALAVLMATAEGAILSPSERAPERSVPADLERICLRAMAQMPEDRYPSARALYEDLERYQAGTQELERRQADADGLVSAGDESRWYIEMLEGELVALLAQLEARPVSGQAGIEIKRVQWALEDRCAHLKAERTRAFAQASARYVQAIERVPDHRMARARLSDLHWERYREARERNDRTEAQLHLDAVRQYEDPRFVERLSGQVSLTLHTEPSRVEVSLYRVTERDRVWVPVGRRVLGRTPLVCPIPTGRQLIELRAPGRRPVRLPVMAWPGDALQFGVPLPTDTQLGPTFVYVPAGPYVRGNDPKAVQAQSSARVFVEAFAIQRYPVTVAEYLAFLSSLAPEEAVRRMPRDKGPLFELPADGQWTAPLLDRDGDAWDPAWPVCSISYFDAEAYAAWRSAQDGVRYRLPTEDEWEKAARGTDGRLYPWGEHFDPTFCSMRHSEPGNLLPKPIGTYETDCSPYGVRDLSGGVREWVESWFEDGQRVIRGGAFNLYAFLCRAASRWGAGPRTTQASIGFRLVKVLEE
jgi:serine/threonine-protein kinase